MRRYRHACSPMVTAEEERGRVCARNALELASLPLVLDARAEDRGRGTRRRCRRIKSAARYSGQEVCGEARPEQRVGGAVAEVPAGTVAEQLDVHERPSAQLAVAGRRGALGQGSGCGPLLRSRRAEEALRRAAPRHQLLPPSQVGPGAAAAPERRRVLRTCCGRPSVRSLCAG